MRDILEKYKGYHDDKDFNFIKLNQAILQKGDVLTKGRVVYHGGMLVEEIMLSRALSTTTDIQKAVDHFCYYTNSQGAYGHGECSVFELKVISDDIIAYSYDNNKTYGDLIIGGESEVLLPAGIVVRVDFSTRRDTGKFVRAYKKYFNSDENAFLVEMPNVTKEVPLVYYEGTISLS